MRQMLRTGAAGIGCALVLGLGGARALAQTATSDGGEPRGMVLDRVVAVVSDEALTLSEVQEEGQPVIRKIFQDFVGAERERRMEEAQKRLLEDLIDRRLMYQIAKREGLLPSAAEVNGAVDELKRNNNVTDDAQFRTLLRAEGLTVEQVRRSVGERLAIGRLLARQVRSSIILTEEELQKFYESHQEKYQRIPLAEIRHILIPAPPGLDEATIRSRVEEVVAKIQGGADFVQVSQEYSGERGAELMKVHRGELAPEIEAEAFGLPEGGVSPPIRTAAGWHVIKLERAQREPVAPFAEVRESIREQLFQEKFDAKKKEWLSALRSRTFIQILIQGSALHADSRNP